ncbi:MAG: HAMP domain-containing histidine kinase [Clostridia bacterium]|nr:HAMP domain-containing histidine kinase [Clostridia bacterium]
MDVELLHDLRLSLQLIQASAQMLQLSGNGGEARGYLDALLEGAAQMGQLLDGALKRREARETGPVELMGCLRALCRRCRDYAAARGVDVTLSGNVDALTLASDGDVLSRVILNLVMNAIRFSPPRGSVAVRCTALGDFAEIAVTDVGPGIAPERLPYIFLRGETDGGQGYGLPAAMEGARRLGGSLSACSRPGEGSTFTLRLPVRGRMVS